MFLLLVSFSLFQAIQAECSLMNSTISAFKDCRNEEDLKNQQGNFAKGGTIVGWIFLAIILLACFLWCLCKIYMTCFPCINPSPISSPSPPPSVKIEEV